MERGADKIIVCLGCLAALPFVGVSALEVAGLLAAVIASALFELVPGRARRVGLAAFAAGTLAVPQAALFLPLAAYDVSRCNKSDRRDAAALGVLTAAALAAGLPRMPLPAAALVVCVCGMAAALSWRTNRALAHDALQRDARDAMRERSLALETRNRDLRDKQDYEVHVATLTERGRIAREIHDNVGHLLTRAVLQVEAVQVRHLDDEQLASELAPVRDTLQQALSSVRESVHALHDDAIDLEKQLCACAQQCQPLDVRVEYAVDDAPPAVALCFIAITREALSNAARHSAAEHVDVRAAEYPALYQLVVQNDDKNVSRETLHTRGLGLQSMEERVHALGGTFRAGPGEHGGWRVFASIPKEEPAL